MKIFKTKPAAGGTLGLVTTECPTT